MARRAFRQIGGNQVAVAGGDETRRETSCFADEVAIDFPSVAHAVARMRRAFLAEERAATLPAAIQLSTREARDGATVPLDVPVRCLCRSCGGHGETWAGSCLACTGSGTELRCHTVRVSVPAGVFHGERFHFSVAPGHDAPTRIELRIAIG